MFLPFCMDQLKIPFLLLKQSQPRDDCIQLHPNSYKSPNEATQLIIIKPTPMNHPKRRYKERIPSLPGHPHYGPICWIKFRFESDNERDLHYLQTHLLRVPRWSEIKGVRSSDRGNHSGPLGKGRHILPPEFFCRSPEPESDVSGQQNGCSNSTKKYHTI